LLELVPAALPGEAGTPATPRRGWRLSPAQQRYARGAAAVVVLGLVAVGVSRWPSAAPGGSSSVPKAVEVQLPPLIALKVQARFGSEGGGQGQLHDPRDVAVDPAGNIYVADTGNKRISKFKPDGSLAAGWSESAKGALVEPSSVAVALDGLIVDDSEAAQLHKYDFDGKPVPGFEHDLALSHPRGIAVAPNGTIYVGDTANNRILRVASEGAPLGAFDTKGVKLEQPTGVAVDEQGSIYSIEPAASRIQKFAADGTLQAHLYLPQAVTVYPPRGIWIPGRGLTVSLPEQNELLTYSDTGVPQATFAPEGPAALRPLGLALAPDRRSVWVVWGATAGLTQLLWP
ncbi:MAG TPA: NHL repeat-containing protein, partial [Chloroflexota bacterium]|nr:NHL repeat-containing protein [Chloroflexota bacterium]